MSAGTWPVMRPCPLPRAHRLVAAVKGNVVRPAVASRGPLTQLSTDILPPVRSGRPLSPMLHALVIGIDSYRDPKISSFAMRESGCGRFDPVAAHDDRGLLGHA